MKNTQADRITALLEEMVLTGQFQNGQRLDEAGLALKFDVSRTPVREALQRLVMTQLAEQLPRRGVFVRQPSPLTLIEMFEMMAEIEGICSRLTAQRADKAELEDLKHLNTLCLKAIKDADAARYSQHNEAFHHMIYRLSGNSFLEAEAVRLYRLLKPFRRVQFRMRGRMADSVAEHGAIINAMTSGNFDVSAQLSRAHVATQGERFYLQMALLKRNPEYRIAS